MSRCIVYLSILFLIVGCGGGSGAGGGGESDSGSSDTLAPTVQQPSTDTPTTDSTVSSSPDSSTNETDTSSPDTSEETVTTDIDNPLIIMGYFVTSETADSSRTSRIVTETEVQLQNKDGEVLGTSTTDIFGRFDIFEFTPFNEADLPVQLVATANGVTYTSPIIPSDGPMVVQLNDFTSSVSEYDSSTPITTSARLNAIAEILTIKLFGVNELGNPNVPAETFLTGDFESPNSLGNLLTEAAVQSSVNFRAAVNGSQPLLNQSSYVDALTTVLQTVLDSEVALEPLADQAGSSQVVNRLTRLSVVTTDEEKALNRDNLITLLNETLSAGQERANSLQQQLAQSPAQPNAVSSVQAVSLVINGVSNMDEQTTADFTATVTYSDQTQQTIEPTWVVLGNGEALVDSNGTVTAGAIESDTSVTLRAHYGGLSTTRILTIQDRNAALVSLTIEGSSTITEQSTGQYTVTATYDDGSTRTVQPTWSDNSVDAVIDSTGTLISFGVSSSTIVTLTASFNGRTTTKNILIEDQDKVVAFLTINGDTQINEQSTAIYTATATYTDGSSAIVSPSWSISSGGIAIVDSGGTVTAGEVLSSSATTLTATFQGVSATKTVFIQNQTKTVVSLAISGETTLDEQSTAIYTVTATYNDGSTAVIAPSWSVDGSGLAVIDSGGTLTAGSVISDTTVTLTASFSGKTTTKTVTINNLDKATLSIAVSGNTVIDENSTATYTATATFDDSTTAVVSPSWTLEASGLAIIDSGGTLTAGNVTTDTTVTIVAQYGGKSATKTVSITNISKTLTALTINGSDTVDEETTSQYSATASYSDGTTSEVSPIWSLDGDSATLSATGLLTANTVNTDTTVTITASFNGTDATKTVTIRDATPTHLLTVNLSGTGIVTSNPSGIDCGSDCIETFIEGTTVTLTATPPAGSIFQGWSGEGCTGTGTCTVIMSASRTITASFQSGHRLDVQVSGSGTVTSSPAGIDCGSDCDEIFAVGTSVTLTATPESGGRFLNWSGGGCSGTGTSCTFTVSTTTVVANFTRTLFRDIGVNEGWHSGYMPSSTWDSTNSKLLTTTTNCARGNRLSLFRCDMDGTNCTHRLLTSNRGYYSDVLADSVNNKLLTIYAESSQRKGTLLYCDMDGTNCVTRDISGGAGRYSGYYPSAVIDRTNSKLLVAFQNGANQNRLGLSRCDLDGNNCTYINISAGQSVLSGYTPDMVIDTTNQKILVATRNAGDRGRISLFRCDLDGTNCSHQDISVGQTSNYNPSIALDTTNNKILVAVRSLLHNNRPIVFRCDLDGTNCSYHDVSAGLRYRSGYNPSLAVDATNGQILISTNNYEASQKPYLFRCSLEASNCSSEDISAGTGSDSGRTPQLLIDSANSKVRVVTENRSINFRPGLHSVPLTL